MKYVYLLQSLSHTEQTYVGITNNLKQRLADHNQLKNKHTSKFAPWRIVTAIYFTNEAKALAFEKYLKKGSGYAFARKHLF